MAFLTDRTLASGVTSNDLIHIVITGDTSQNPAGSSYKATMGQVLDLINPTTLTGGTYDPLTGTITFYDDSGGSFNVTGLVTGYTNTAVTGFTYDDSNTFTIIENDLTTHSASINVVTGMTFNGFLQTSGSSASGIYSFSIGETSSAIGDYSLASGDSSIANGDNSHAEGSNSVTSVNGKSAHAEGSNTLADGQGSHSEGDSTITYGDTSHAEGLSTTTYGTGSHAEGQNTITYGDYSHAEGVSTISSGTCSHSEGRNTLASGSFSHSEGNTTTSIGLYSHTEGQDTFAYGISSHAEGLGTITNGDYQHVQGQFNSTASTQSAFIIGNGTDDLNRSNLVLAAGNTFNIYGNLNVTGNTTLSATTASTLNISSTPLVDSGLTTYYLTRDSSNGNVKTKIIPGATVYGLFAQTGNSVAVSATTVESTIIDGGVGTLSVPVNGFSVGDSFRADFGGLLSAKNNDTIRIRIKAGSVILADSGTQTMTSTVNDVFQLSVNFTIRKIGVAGAAEIVTIGVFHTTKQSNGSQTGFAFNTINTTTFDTTISNTLDVTAQWSSNSALNSIYSDIFILNKIF